MVFHGVGSGLGVGGMGWIGMGWVRGRLPLVWILFRV